MGEIRHQMSTSARDGEITINLVLTIRVESDGSLSVAAAPQPAAPPPRPMAPVAPQAPARRDEWATPDLGDEPSVLIDFGKGVEG